MLSHVNEVQPKMPHEQIDVPSITQGEGNADSEANKR